MLSVVLVADHELLTRQGASLEYNGNLILGHMEKEHEKSMDEGRA